MTIEAGGYVNGFLFEDRRVMGSGLEFSAFVVGPSSSVFIGDGQRGTDLLVINGGTLTFREGAVTGGDGITVQSGGHFFYETGEETSETHILFKHSAMINRIQLAHEMTVDSLQGLVLSGGVVKPQSYGSSAFVSSGQTALDTLVVSVGRLSVLDGAKAIGMVVSSAGLVEAHSGAVLRDATIRSGANIFVDGTISGENITLISGATANGITVAEDTNIALWDDHVFRGMITDRNAGVLYSGQTAEGVLIGSSASLAIGSGAGAVDTVANGRLYVSSGGTASRTTLGSGGSAFVSSGGVMDEVTVNSGGNLYVSSGGSATVVFNPWQGTVTAGDDANVVFLDRDANIYLGGDSAGLTGRADSFSLIQLTSGISAVIYADGVADGVYVNDDATLNVLSGGTAHVLFTPWNENASVSAEEGASVIIHDRDANVYYGCGDAGVLLKTDAIENFAVTSGNSMIVYADGVASDVSIRHSGSMNIESGGMAENISVDGNGVLFVSSGAVASVAYNPWGGTVLTEDGADVTYLERDANIYCGGKSTGLLQKGDVILDYNISSGDSMIVYEGGFASHVNVNDSGIIEILSGGTADVAFNPWHGSMYVAEGGTITHLDREFDVYYGGNKSGLVSSADEMDGLTITSGNSAIVYSGGTVRNVTTESRGFLLISSGGIAVDTDLNAAYTASYTVINNAGASVYGYHGHIYISEGGLGLNARISGGTQHVLSGGVASRTELMSVGEAVVSSGGESVETTLTNGGRLCISGGGVARDVHAQHAGAIIVSRFGLAENVVLDAKNIMLVSSEGSVSDVQVRSGGRLYMREGAVLNGHLRTEDGAVVLAYDGAAIDFDLSNGNSDTPFIDNLKAISGNPDFTVTITEDVDAGIYLLAYGADDFSGSISVQDDVLCYGVLSAGDSIACGRNTYRLELSDGVLSLVVARSGAPGENEGEPIDPKTVYNATLFTGETLVVSGRDSYYETTINGRGFMNVLNGGLAEHTDVLMGGVLTVGSGGAAFETTVSNAQMEVLSGGTVTGVLLGNSAVMYISGGTVNQIVVSRKNWYHIPALIISNGGLAVEVENASVQVADGGRVLSGTVGEARVSSGGFVGSTVITGKVSVYENGSISDNTVSGGGDVCLYSGGYASNTLIKARMSLSGGTAEDTLVTADTVYVYSGGVMEHAELQKVLIKTWWGALVWTSGSALISEGGLALDTVISGGDMIVSRGGVASRTEIASAGSQIVSYGGKSIETTLTNGGRLNVSRAGVAENVHAKLHAAIVVDSYGTASAVELDQYNMLVASRHCSVIDATIKSGGEVYLYQNAVLGGHVQIESGALVMAYENSVVDFDLSIAGKDTPLFNDLGLILGNPDFTMTLNTELAPGTYLLAGGAEDFDRSITVQNDPVRYGTLTVGGSLAVG